jgi:hypothetical protein
MRALDVAFGLNHVYVEELNGCNKIQYDLAVKDLQKGNGPGSKPVVPKRCSRASILSMMLNCALDIDISTVGG